MLGLSPRNGSASKFIFPTKKCAREKFTETHKIIHTERDLRGSLVQLLAETSVSFEIRTGCQGFTQLGLENLQAQRLYNFSGQPAPLLDCPHGEKVSPL